MKNRLIYRLFRAALALALFGSLIGCSSPGPGPVPTPNDSRPAGETAAPGPGEASLPATPAPTQAPTATPVPPAAVLLAPPGADTALVERLQPALTELARQSGLRFETRPSLTPEELQGQAVRVVVALPPDPGLGALAAASPETQFLSIGIPGVQAGGNLSAVTAGGGRPDLQAFLAGYLAAIITPDWRAGVLTEAGNATGGTARTAFTNGVVFYCGLCRPAYPPFPIPGYPLAAEFTPGAGEAGWQAAIADFKTWQVDTVYVFSSTPDENFLTFLADSGFQVISSSPPPAGTEISWAASLSSGDPLPAVQELWPKLLNGEGGQSLELPLALDHINPELLSPGRQRLVDNLLADLLAGLVDTGASPQGGE